MLWHSAHLCFDEEVADPFLGRPSHVPTFEVRKVVSRNEHLGLLKAHSAEALHDRASQRTHFVATSIALPMLHERVTVQQLEEHFAHLPTTAIVVPTCGSNPPVSRRPYLTWS